jgi:hypothetical protein
MPVMRTELLAAYLPQLRAQISSKLYMIKDIIMREVGCEVAIRMRCS